MSKPIVLTEELIRNTVADFENKIRTQNMANGSFTYTRKFDYEKDVSITIWFTPAAYSKMLVLLQHFSSEVAWHGITERTDNGFIISDILIYPQEVTGSTVNTDQEEYQKWLMGLDDDSANRLLMQGHSHVNMSTTPSKVDTDHQEKILGQLNGDNYYIFMIWNKSLSHTVKVYDLENNTLYEDSDITVAITDPEYDTPEFVKHADSLVKPRVYQPTAKNTAYQGKSYLSKGTRDGYLQSLDFDEDTQNYLNGYCS